MRRQKPFCHKDEYRMSPVLTVGYSYTDLWGHPHATEIPLPLPRRELDGYFAVTGIHLLSASECRSYNIQSAFRGIGGLRLDSPIDLLHLNRMGIHMQGLTDGQLEEFQQLLEVFDIHSAAKADALAGRMDEVERYPARGTPLELERKYRKAHQKAAIVGEEYILLPPRLGQEPERCLDLLYLPDLTWDLYSCTLSAQRQRGADGAVHIREWGRASTISHALALLEEAHIGQENLKVVCASRLYPSALSLETRDLAGLFFYTQKLEALQDTPAFVEEMECRAQAIEGGPRRLEQLAAAAAELIDSHDAWSTLVADSRTDHHMDMVVTSTKGRRRSALLRFPNDLTTLRHMAKKLGMERWEPGAYRLRSYGINEYAGVFRTFGESPPVEQLSLLAYQLACVKPKTRWRFLEEAAQGGISPKEMLERMGKACRLPYDPERIDEQICALDKRLERKQREEWPGSTQTVEPGHGMGGIQ